MQAHTFLILTVRVSLPTDAALRSRKDSSSLRPPPLFWEARLSFRPCTLSVVVFAAFIGREERLWRPEGSMPADMRIDKLPLLPLMTRFTISAAFEVGLGGRAGAVEDRVERRGPVGTEELLPREFPRPAPFVAAGASMSRSPSLSVLVGPPARRLLMPPRAFVLPLPVEVRAPRWFRGPVGGAIAAVWGHGCEVRECQN
jgi:hypothetical protein